MKCLTQSLAQCSTDSHFLHHHSSSCHKSFLFSVFLWVFFFLVVGGVATLHGKQDLNTPASSLTDFPGGSDGKASVYNAGDWGLIPGWGRSSGEGNGNPLQYYCLENPMDRGAR